MSTWAGQGTSSQVGDIGVVVARKKKQKDMRLSEETDLPKNRKHNTMRGVSLD